MITPWEQQIMGYVRCENCVYNEENTSDFIVPWGINMYPCKHPDNGEDKKVYTELGWSCEIGKEKEKK